MAKMFYTMEETKAALGRNEEEVKQLCREGRLREFRDGPRLMFKADQVETLKAELGGGGDNISLSPETDTGAPIGMAGDSKVGSSAGSGAGSVLGLADTGMDQLLKDDTTLTDTGLGGTKAGTKAGTRAGSVAGSPGSGVGSGSGASRGGITIFDVDDSQKADPSAQTSINPSAQEQALENVGSGSGLLDLTRESDDTSLGAVFDELTPAGKTGAPAARRPTPAAGAAASMETQAGADMGLAAARRAVAAPIAIEETTAWDTAIAWAALGSTLIVGFGGVVLGAAVLDFYPPFMNTIKNGGLMYLGIAAGVVLVFFALGFVIGRAGNKSE